MKPYRVIYAQPPWAMDDSLITGMRSLSPAHKPEHYEKLGKYRVRSIGDFDTALFMWASAPLLPEAMMLMDDWGYPFRSVAFIWVLTNWKEGGVHRGAKNPTRANAKFLLYGASGEPRFYGRDIDQLVKARDSHVVRAPYRGTGYYPEVFKDKIDLLCGRVAKAHLWADSPSDRETWSHWGPTIESDFRLVRGRK